MAVIIPGRTQREFQPLTFLKPRLGQFIEPVRVGSGYASGGDLPKIAVLTLLTASGDQTLIIDGHTIVTPFTTDDAGTAQAIADSINSNYSLADNSPRGPAGIRVSGIVIATAAAGVVTITGQQAGNDFAIAYEGTGGTLVQDGTGGSQLPTTSSEIELGLGVGIPSGADTSRGAPPLIVGPSAAEFVGITGGAMITQFSKNNIPAFAPQNPVSFLRQGQAVAQVDSAAITAYGTAVEMFVAASTTGKPGSFTNTSSGDTVALPNLIFTGENYWLEGVNLAIIEKPY